MGKNNKAEQKEASKTKTIKSMNPKNKEMFTELKTHQEHKISKFNRAAQDNQVKVDMESEEEANSF